MGGGAATVQLTSARLYQSGRQAKREAGAPHSQPIKLRMMQPKKRLIGREVYPHVPAILLGQGLGAVPRQVAPDEIVHVVVHWCHCVLEPEEIARGLLGRVAHKVRAEGAVLRPFMGYQRVMSVRFLRSRWGMGQASLKLPADGAKAPVVTAQSASGEEPQSPVPPPP